MTLSNIWTSVKKVGVLLADTRIFFFALLWLILLLIAGTVAQANMGLHQAQMKYFSSIFIWVWYIPLPGGALTLGTIFIGLSAILIFKRPKWRTHGGVIVTHFGALLLLFGGFVTGVFSREGTMSITEGDTVGWFSDHNKVEFVVTDISPADHDMVTAFAPGWLKEGRMMQSDKLPFKMEVLKFCRNCRLVKRRTPADSTHKMTAADSELVELTSDPEGRNRAGIKILVSGAGSDDGIYTVLEFDNDVQALEIGKKMHALLLRKARTVLPFKLHLLDFEKKVHPGTEMARSYKSVVKVIDEKIEQRTVIQMNEPLRYRGYTFYQSSFQEGPRDVTVLSVVHNVGRLFPYISSLIMSIGLLLHLMMQVPKLLSRGEES